MLAVGEHPVNQVISDLNKLGEDTIYLLIAPFLTAPLIDKATSLGFQHWVNQVSSEEFRIYFSRG